MSALDLRSSALETLEVTLVNGVFEHILDSDQRLVASVVKVTKPYP